MLYETHSAFVTVKVVKTQFFPSKRETYIYIGLSDGTLIELEGREGNQLRQFKWFKEQEISE